MKYSQQSTFSWSLYTNENRSTTKRAGEVKLAEQIKFGQECSVAEFVIIGISEDVGPQMNDGFGGAKNGFTSAVNAIQGSQSNDYSSELSIGILGEITQNKPFVSKNEAKGWVEELDDFVKTILTQYISKRQKLIVIGGGHNNAFPILDTLYSIHENKLQSINIDPHADCRTTEFRHSGNPFSSAIDKGILMSYSVYGLHESYNNQYILDYLKSNNCKSSTFESYLDDSTQWWNNFENSWKELESSLPIVLDIDLDAIAFAPSSALTPSGFSIEEIRRIIRVSSKSSNIQALHLPEGAPKTEVEMRLYGKMIAYFVLDFIKMQKNR